MIDNARRFGVGHAVRRLRSIAVSLRDRVPRPMPPARVNALRFAARPSVAPPACACCGAVASESLREVHARSGASIIVPYCTECLFHASSVRTRQLGVALSSLLVAMTLTAAIPLVGLDVDVVTYVVTIGALSAVPLSIGAVSWRPPRVGHSA